MDIELWDGRSVTVRMIHPDDASGILELYRSLSERTRRLRYHGYSPEMGQEQALVLSQCHPARQVAVVTTYRDEAGENIAGVARYARVSVYTVEAETAIPFRESLSEVGETPD